MWRLRRGLLLVAVVPACARQEVVDVTDGDHHHHHHRHHGHGHHHGHHHHHGHKHDAASTQSDASPPPKPASPTLALPAPTAVSATTVAPPASAPVHPPVAKEEKVKVVAVTRVAQSAAESKATDQQIMEKMQNIESVLAAKEKNIQRVQMSRGQIQVNAPLPPDFGELFASAVAQATGTAPEDVSVIGATPTDKASDKLDDIVFKAHADVVKDVQKQASDPDSKLAHGPLRMFLIARDGSDSEDQADVAAISGAAVAPAAAAPASAAPEIDSSAMPYGDLEPFGREDTAQELTESSIRESDAMVDQLERAEVAEEKRAVFRALTRLRGAAITSYDGIARSQTGNIDEYARKSNWRKSHPVQHLAKEEADTSRWAFPDNSDF